MQHATTGPLADHDRRAAERRPLDSGATLRDGLEPIDALAEDVSQTGCAIRTVAALAIGQIVRIGVAGMPTVEAVIVRHEGDRYGCRFLAPLTAADIRSAGRTRTIVHGGFPAIVQRAIVPEAEPAASLRMAFPKSFALILATSLSLWVGGIAALRWLALP